MEILVKSAHGTFNFSSTDGTVLSTELDTKFGTLPELVDLVKLRNVPIIHEEGVELINGFSPDYNILDVSYWVVGGDYVAAEVGWRSKPYQPIGSYEKDLEEAKSQLRLVGQNQSVKIAEGRWLRCVKGRLFVGPTKAYGKDMAKKYYLYGEEIPSAKENLMGYLNARAESNSLAIIIWLKDKINSELEDVMCDFVKTAQGNFALVTII